MTHEIGQVKTSSGNAAHFVATAVFCSHRPGISRGITANLTRVNDFVPTLLTSPRDQTSANYQPDLLYSDSVLPFDNVRRSMLAHYYNQDMAKNGGKFEAVYNCKEESQGKWVRDIERGVAEGISPEPWQTDTSIGDWYYRTRQKYKSSTESVQMLTEIVSKNGNLLINIVQTPEGDLEPDMLKTLDEIGDGIAVNGKGIYSTRPWKIYGEGPSTQLKEKGQHGGLKDVHSQGYTAEDFRSREDPKKQHLASLDQ